MPAPIRPEVLAQIQKLRLAGVADRDIAQRVKITKRTLNKYPWPGYPGAPDPETGLIPDDDTPAAPTNSYNGESDTGDVRAAASTEGQTDGSDFSPSDEGVKGEPPPESGEAPPDSEGEGYAASWVQEPAPTGFARAARDMGALPPRPPRRSRWSGWDDMPDDDGRGDGGEQGGPPRWYVGDLRAPRGLETDDPSVIRIPTDFTPEVIYLWRQTQVDWPPQWGEPPTWADWVNGIIAHHYTDCLHLALVLARRVESNGQSPEPAAAGSPDRNGAT